MIIFERKKLSHSRDSNHRSPVLHICALTNQATVTCIPTRKQSSLSFKFQSKTLVNATCYYSHESNPKVGILVSIYLYINQSPSPVQSVRDEMPPLHRWSSGLRMLQGKPISRQSIAVIYGKIKSNKNSIKLFLIVIHSGNSDLLL